MSLNQEQKVFSWFVFRDHPESLEEFLAHFPKNVQNEILEFSKNVSQTNAYQLQDIARQELKKISTPQKNTYLSEVHSDWLVEILKTESPAMIANVLRYFPQKRKEYILHALPKEKVNAMPSLLDSFDTPKFLVKILKEALENEFLLHKSPKIKASLVFQDLCLFKSRELEAVFKEAGYREVAMGLKLLPAQAQKIVLSKLQVKDRLKVQEDLKGFELVSENRLKKAQIHLVSKDIDMKNQNDFILELGLLILAKSVLKKDEKDVFVIKRKMSKKNASVLEELIKNYQKINTEATVLSYQEDLILAMKKVALQN